MVSEIAFGCGGNAGLMVRGSPAEQLPIVARALDLGVNYFDNAPDYGDGVAETNLGIVLKSLGARPILNTKVEIRAENLDDVAGHVVRSAEASLRRLGVDRVDMFQIHNGPSRVDPKLQGRTYTQLSLGSFPAARRRARWARTPQDGRQDPIRRLHLPRQRWRRGAAIARHRRVSPDQRAVHSVQSHGWPRAADGTDGQARLWRRHRRRAGTRRRGGHLQSARQRLFDRRQRRRHPAT